MNARPDLIAQARFDSPLGPICLAASARGLAGLWFDAQAHHPGALDAPDDPSQPHIALARRELAAFWRDPTTRFTVPLDVAGTPFQQAVWRVLRSIAPGRRCSYGDVARRLGHPSAVRAVGAAVGRNPIGIIVPCHRVVGSDGSLTGYAGGLPRKTALLQAEAALSAPSEPPAPSAHSVLQAPGGPVQTALEAR
jgi:methylated-DNA-[protein]-cysteine S-methyltransferase